MALAAVVGVAGLIVWACTPPLSPDDVRLVPASIAAVSSTTLSGVAGEALSPAPSVRVLARDNEPLPNIQVLFAPGDANSGTVTPSQASTNADGTVAVGTWTLPTQVGIATLRASVAQNQSLTPATFTATVTAGPPQQVNFAASSNNQSAVAGTETDVAPAVRVVDQYGNPAQASVTFAVASGGGVIVPANGQVQTGTDGIARLTSWTLGVAAGENTLTATVTASGVQNNPLTFTATGTAGEPATIVIAPGDPTSQGQTAQGQTRVAVAPAVLVTDANGNAVADATIRFSVNAGGGLVFADANDATGASSQEMATDANGIATLFAWQLGSVGENSLEVEAKDFSSVPAFSITATATAGAAAQIAVDATTDNQSAIVNTAVASPPSVFVGDNLNNAVANESVTFTVGPGSSTIEDPVSHAVGVQVTVVTGADGKATLASWTLGQLGSNTLTAALTSNAGIFATFTATGTVGPPATINVNPNDVPGSDGQTVIAHEHVAVAPAVLIEDANGLPTPDVDVRFDVSTGGGEIADASLAAPGASAVVTTDADGIARLGYWAPAGVGTNNLVATVVSNEALTLTFTATGTLGPATSITVVNGAWPYTRQGFLNGGVPTVVVADQAGNLLPNEQISWSSGDNNSTSSVTGTTTSQTDANGVASFGGAQGGLWTSIGAQASQMILRATVQSTAIFTDITSITVGPVAAANPASATTIDGTVNARTGTDPAVVLIDGSSNPVPGVAVDWTVTQGNGSAATGTTVTDSVGVASVAWTLGTTAGFGADILRASESGSGAFVDFTGNASADVPAQISKIAGDGQTASAGAQLPTAIEVQVLDQYGNAVSNASVTFQPRESDAIASPASSTTDGSGFATTAWTLGAAAGTQSLDAFVTDNAGLTTQFTATALDPCAAVSLAGAPFSDNIDTADCVDVVNSQNYYQDNYSLDLSSQTSFSVTLSSNDFAPRMESHVYGGSGGYWYNESGGPGTSTSNFVLPAASGYAFTATTSRANAPATGSYTLTTSASPDFSGCANIIVAKGITVTHQLDLNCNYSPYSQLGTAAAKRYLIFLPAGQSLTVRMNSVQLDAYIEAFDVSGGSSVGIANDDSNGAAGGVDNAAMTIASAGTDRFIAVYASHWTNSGANSPTTGTYDLIIDP